ncbi:hypothetical protein MANES_01G198080v8 [Manihot esculenta]|uniref:Peptidase M24 domain-containing protein n=1 Tax=Manihot esculenta TaxID=3983 RepID=A0A2C9WMF9_MANES|nr:hypothetical protein MANES_01G198080v8 [Manihot esculenta]
MWLDGWTVVTADGKRIAQFGHTLLNNRDSVRYSWLVIIGTKVYLNIF